MLPPGTDEPRALLMYEREKIFFIDMFNKKQHFHSFCPHMQDAIFLINKKSNYYLMYM